METVDGAYREPLFSSASPVPRETKRPSSKGVSMDKHSGFSMLEGSTPYELGWMDARINVSTEDGSTSLLVVRERRERSEIRPQSLLPLLLLLLLYLLVLLLSRFSLTPRLRWE